MRLFSLRSLIALCLFSTPALADDLHQGVSADLNLDLMLSNLNAPTGGAFLPDGRLLITEQFSGRVLLWDGTGAPSTIGSVDIQTGSERGLLGITVDPLFATSGRVYFYYSTGDAQAVGYAVMDAATDALDTANMTVLLTGMAANRNHNGGGLAFGPDGHLYIGVGDTGCNCGCAPGTNTSNYSSTCLTGLKGKVLRIDRDGGIPADNPLVNETSVASCGEGNTCRAARTAPTGTGAPRTEIYNWGFRNPWRFAFDEQSGNLWIGDVGEVTWEEITVSTGPGQHHGWPYREGEAGQPRARCNEITPQSGDCKEPAVAYPRSGGGSVTGGVFSNHCSWPAAWHGVYWFGDYAQARVWSVTPNSNRDGANGAPTTVVTGAAGPVQFMRGPDGGIYYLDVNTGTLWRITPSSPAPCDGMDAMVIVDSGPVADSGPAADTGIVADSGVDSGTSPVDSGAATSDSGTPVTDSGVVRADSGASPVDAGTPGDADDSCRCVRAQSSGNALGVLMLGLFLGLRIRRRR
jgi:glucose/arabinose dehydrogenase